MTRLNIAAVSTLLSLVAFAGSSDAKAENLSVLSWNVEDWQASDSGVIATQLRDDFDGIDIFGLSEVSKVPEFALYARYAGEDEQSQYKAIGGTTGANTKLGIVYRTDRLNLIESYEMLDMMGTPAPGKPRTGRAPLVAHLRTTAEGTDFLFVVNHFHRGDEKRRLEQAMLFASWAKEQSMPIIAVGDYNFDFDVDTKRGNQAFDALMAINSFRWIEPSELVTTNWSDRGEDGENDYNSILDFVFLANAEWTASSKVVVRPNDFPDDGYTSDHRPVLGLFNTTGDKQAALDPAGFLPAGREEEAPSDAAFMAPTPQQKTQTLSATASMEVERSLAPRAFVSMQTIAPTDNTAQLETLMQKIEALTTTVQELKAQINK